QHRRQRHSIGSIVVTYHAINASRYRLYALLAIPRSILPTFLKITERQVRYAIASDQVTPRRRSGYPHTLTDAQVDELEAYIRSSRRWYARRVALAKPPLTQDVKDLCLEWAEQHVNWEPWQWWRILWSDETWVTGGRHRRRWVTRKTGEDFDPTCVIDKVPKKRGWMFWACFSGATKGPSLFWEKEWKSINKERYFERIVPLIHGWLRLFPDLQFMQDSAPGHRAGCTLNELQERDIVPIYWPPFSPDLNPIELIWNRLKHYIEIHYPDLPGGRQRTYDQLRGIVQEA
ncbi:hypothetical protein BU25DRAFT_484018, partial [Macroventuria anomochaeta]